MKHILFFVIFALFASTSSASVVTKTVTKTSTGEGHGVTREEAINNAIVEAIGKMSGVNINSIKQSNIISVNSNSGSDMVDSYNENITKATKGRADSYEVIDAYQDSKGNWVAKVAIKNSKTTKSYKAPGLSSKSRRSVSVFDSSSHEYRQLGERLKKYIIADLLESRKFNILDRDNSGYYAMEKALIGSADAASDEIYKLKNVIGSDYFLLFNIAGAQGQTKTSNLTGKITAKIEVAVDYQVILFATRQIKYSNSLTMAVNVKNNINSSESAIAKIASKISQDILNAIYPLKVAAVNGGEAVFTQKLNIGDVYECFSQGERLQDSYTKESTSDSRVETKVGTIEITRADPKLSYGKITQGSVKKDNICRPLGGGSGAGYNIGRDANYQINDGGGVNLGF